MKIQKFSLIPRCHCSVRPALRNNLRDLPPPTYPRYPSAAPSSSPPSSSWQGDPLESCQPQQTGVFPYQGLLFSDGIQDSPNGSILNLVQF